MKLKNFDHYTEDSSYAQHFKFLFGYVVDYTVR